MLIILILESCILYYVINIIHIIKMNVSGWSNYGMDIIEDNSTNIHCTTNHFTSFAVLMQNPQVN